MSPLLSFYPERLRTGPKGGPGGSFIPECSVSNALTMSNPVKKGKLLHQGRASLSKRPVPFFLLLRTLLTFVCMLLAPSPPLLLRHTFLHFPAPRPAGLHLQCCWSCIYHCHDVIFTTTQREKKKASRARVRSTSLSRKPEIAPKTFLFPTRTHFPPQKRHAKKTVDFGQADHITAIPCDLLVGSVCLS